jgi:2-dehydropantoate 2-reductase
MQGTQTTRREIRKVPPLRQVGTMKEIKSALVVGAGAIGAAVASRIFDIDARAIAICATGDRRERYERNGFIVNEKRYAFKLADVEMDAPFDLIIVAVKNYDLAEAIEEMRPFVGPHTTIISLLNGITSEEILRKEFGAEKVPIALIIGIDALRIGGKISFGSPGEIWFGDEKNEADALSARVAAVSGFFAAHNVPASVPHDMIRALWFKYMFNVGINQWSAVLRAPYGLFQVSPSSRALVAETMKEVIALSRALGTGLDMRDIDVIFATIDKLDGEGKTSMLQDVEAERKTEVEAFAGVVVEKSRACGLDAPINQALLLAIRTMGEDFAHRSKTANV